MPIPTIPTVTEIRNRIQSDIESKLNQTTPALFKAFTRVIAGAISGFDILIYQAILWTYKQIYPDTADEVALNLAGALVGITRLAAVFAVIQCDVTGVNGYTLQQGVTFRGSNNVVYKVTTGGVIGGGVISAELTAQESGEIGNLPDGTFLDIVQPDANLDGTAEITATNTSGDDQETLDSYRTRVSAEYKKRRTGGAPADYEAWGLQASNFDWVSPLDDPDTAGEVIVYGRVDNQTDGIPSGGQLTELETFLNLDPVTGLRTRHPIGPPTDEQPISRFLFDIEIFLQNGTGPIEADITTAVTEYVETQEPFNEAIHFIRKDTISEGGISAIANDVANPQSATVTAVILEQTAPPLVITNYQLFGGEFGKVNSIIYTPVL
ncbi:hypothetical protein LCGC14_1220350 [marine sediment metagenome]|uniref:Baseplate protein J-like barrel domain-containing protein n=1 Tax=marine sediment metagenome TaxID=412755 RepID=A0A0F9LBF1_9ZZZZ